MLVDKQTAVLVKKQEILSKGVLYHMLLCIWINIDAILIVRISKSHVKRAYYTDYYNLSYNFVGAYNSLIKIVYTCNITCEWQIIVIHILLILQLKHIFFYFEKSKIALIYFNNTNIILYCISKQIQQHRRV